MNIRELRKKIHHWTNGLEGLEDIIQALAIDPELREQFNFVIRQTSKDLEDQAAVIGYVTNQM